MNAVTVWLYSLMVYLAPPEKLAAAPQYAGWEETAPQKQERYQEIAEALYKVVYAPDAKSIYGGARGRAHTAVTLLALSFMESGFAHDVDKGPCSSSRPRGMDCDGRQAAGLGQIRVEQGKTLLAMHGIEGKTQEDIFADRELMFRIELFMVRQSFLSCRKYGADWALNVYASGSCTRATKSAAFTMLDGKLVPEPDGLPPGRTRLLLARRLIARAPVPGPDKDFVLPSPPTAVSLSAPADGAGPTAFASRAR